MLDHNTQYAIRNTRYAIRDTRYAIRLKVRCQIRKRNTKCASKSSAKYAIRNTKYEMRLKISVVSAEYAVQIRGHKSHSNSCRNTQEPRNTESQNTERKPYITGVTTRVSGQATGVRCAGMRKKGERGRCNVWSAMPYTEAEPLRRGSPFCHHHRVQCEGLTQSGERCCVTSSSEPGRSMRMHSRCVMASDAARITLRMLSCMRRKKSPSLARASMRRIRERSNTDGG